MSSTFLHIKFWEYNFLSPAILWLLILPVVFLTLRYYMVRKGKGVVKTSRTTKQLHRLSFSLGELVHVLPYVFLLLGSSLMIMALARPHNPSLADQDEDIDEGIDIIISLDVSGSMLATDFMPNRLEAAKEVAKEFIDNRGSDRIGLVVYEGEAYTACPATRNHEFLKKSLDEVESGWLEPGTAIGTGLGTAVARLRSDSLTSKVVILLSDGENNKGDITPEEATALAKQKDVRVYTIGVGKEGYASMPVNTPFGTMMQNTLVSIDEKLLKKIANQTDGKYFRATDNQSLREIYSKIDEMEKIAMVEDNIYKEMPIHPSSFIQYALLFLLLGWGIEMMIYRHHG